MTIRNFALAGSIALLGLATQNANAFDTSKLTMRVRVINIEPADKSSAGGALSLPADAINVDSKVAPDIDFEYALTPNVGVELLLTVPQRHDVNLEVNGTKTLLGSVQHLPPTLTAKYYFLTDKMRPYLGAGVNFTWFTDNDLNKVADLKIKRTSVGLALQAGLDVRLNDKWSLSFDAKKADISTDVSLKATGAKVTTVSVDPYIYGAGVGYRF